MRGALPVALCLSLYLVVSSSTTWAAEEPAQSSDESMQELLQGFDADAGAKSEIGSDKSINQVLEGFEDDATESNQPAVDDLMKGFDDTSKSKPAPSTLPQTSSSPLNTGLTVRASTSYNIAHEAPAPGKTDYRGLSRARLQLVPEVRWKTGGGWRGVANANIFYDAAYQINGRDQYTKETLDEYESEVEVRELYMQGSLTTNLDLKLGRQIVVWGTSDNMRITDVLNPLDQREVGMVDIEDLRLPVTMARLDYYSGDWQWTGIAIPEIRFNKFAAFGSEFYPSNLPPPPEEIPADAWANMEYAMAVSGHFHGWDISFHAADYYNDDFYFDPGPPLTRRHSRLSMGGIAFNTVSGSFLYKTEFAYLNGLQFNHGDGADFSRLDFMLGLDYSGIQDVTLTLEIMDRYLPDYIAALELAPDNVKQHEGAIAVRYTQNFLHERLELMLLAMLSGDLDSNGGFSRLQLTYDLTDTLNISGGGVFYQGGDGGFFDAIANNDRMFLELEYNL
jgi:hypothetical protein